MPKYDYGCYLREGDTENIFTLPNGDYIIVAGVKPGNSFPDTISLQERHRDGGDGEWTEWSNTIDDLTTTNRNDIFASASDEGIELRILASAPGASVNIYRTAASTGI